MVSNDAALSLALILSKARPRVLEVLENGLAVDAWPFFDMA